jgi:hypothetical protein
LLPAMIASAAVTAALALAPAASANTGSATDFTCTSVTFTFNQNADFPSGTNVVTETVTSNNTVVGSGTSSFTGGPGSSSSTNTVTVTLPSGTTSAALTADAFYSNTDAGVTNVEVGGFPVTEPVTCPSPPPSTCTSSVVSNFNGTSILGGDYIWFNSVFKPKGVPTSGTTTIQLNSATATFSANGTDYTVPLPPTQITFSSSVTQATLTFQGGQYVETVPAGFTDNVFLSGIPFTVPAGGLPGGIHPVTLQISANLPSGVSLQWQWGAAVYSPFPISLWQAQFVKPLHSTSLDAFHNGDQAGTPENVKQFVVGGARGGGGSNFTGSYSSTGTCS